LSRCRPLQALPLPKERLLPDLKPDQLNDQPPKYPELSRRTSNLRRLPPITIDDCDDESKERKDTTNAIVIKYDFIS
jgi:hypothetical protein